jgi:hypothetical protein
VCDQPLEIKLSVQQIRVDAEPWTIDETFLATRNVPEHSEQKDPIGVRQYDLEGPALYAKSMSLLKFLGRWAPFDERRPHRP